ncbi:hypothetical protein EYF80_029624 [Liparis tanakae]|uniref:Uncharacterized protein n=1 Tax=Liparis tanakae TaxID=230148 RepID=A0A4Z2H3J8_9TELE|nr:hypothetical protein EYF80_029624 [Liparis tanakae]
MQHLRGKAGGGKQMSRVGCTTGNGLLLSALSRDQCSTTQQRLHSAADKTTERRRSTTLSFLNPCEGYVWSCDFETTDFQFQETEVSADASRGAVYPSCQLASTLPPACACGQPGAHVTEINTVSPAAAIADSNTRPVCGIGPIKRAARR